jgi:predicted DNA-binding protein (MmcQ/YjbR family)
MKPRDAFKALRKVAKAYPGAWEDHPWGETVYKVGKKVFVFLGVDKGEGAFGLSCKLPQSSEAAVTMFSFAAPTGYGLGKSGWVSARFGKTEDVPVGLLEQWIEESYVAVAPKRTVKAPARRARKRA